MDIPRMNPCIPLPLPDDVLEDVVDKAKDWALMHGACMRSKTAFSKDSLQFAPFVLVPSSFPRKEFEKAVAIQPILNELMHKVAHNYDFLSESLRSTIEVDDFTGRLFRIYETIRKEGSAQPLSLGMIRSDIMLESDAQSERCKDLCSHTSQCFPFCCWKQVEINTIASGFGWMGPVSGLIHRYVLQELGHGDKLTNLPKNNALEGLVGAMVQAWEIYNSKKAVILFVIEDITYNICDQRFHEFEIRRQNPDVYVIRRNLTEIGKNGKLTSDKALVIDGYEVAVVYYRAGYVPDQYHSELEWEARLMVERSRALKCPTIHYHLAGTKKVQQALARPLALERFLKEPEKVEAVREIFTGLYSLDFDEFGDKAVAQALQDPEKYVLKPQREGGGNNVYGVKIREELMKVRNSKERTAWILMDRIVPPVIKSYMVRPGGIIHYKDVVSELGIFGVTIGDENRLLLNKQVGHMLRTKLSSADEGGVAAGLGAMDSPFLVDVDRCCDQNGAACNRNH